MVASYLYPFALSRGMTELRTAAIYGLLEKLVRCCCGFTIVSLKVYQTSTQFILLGYYRTIAYSIYSVRRLMAQESAGLI
jgi:hypothetical protein